MQKCPDKSCRFKTNQAHRLSHHLQTNPAHQPGRIQRVFKGDRQPSGKGSK